MKQVYVNNPKFTVSNIVVSTEHDDLIVLNYIVRKLNYYNHKFTHGVNTYTNNGIEAIINSNNFFDRTEDNLTDNEVYCTKIANELNTYNEGLTDIARRILGFYYDRLYTSELDEQLNMSETVTKLYAEYLMDYK